MKKTHHETDLEKQYKKKCNSKLDSPPCYYIERHEPHDGGGGSGDTDDDINDPDNDSDR